MGGQGQEFCPREEHLALTHSQAPNFSTVGKEVLLYPSKVSEDLNQLPRQLRADGLSEVP